MNIGHLILGQGLDVAKCCSTQEYKKVKPSTSQSEDMKPISDELLTHILYDTKLGTVIDFAKMMVEDWIC